MKTLMLLTIVSLASCLAFPAKHSNLKIYGGKTAKPGQFPFIVAINVTLFHEEVVFCAGSIINENWILTAATCIEFEHFQLEDLVIVSGSNRLDTGGIAYNLSQVVIHPKYNNSNSKENNIALYKIDGSFEFSDIIQPIELGEVSANDSVVAAGWGDTESEETPSDLQYVELTIWSNEDCTKVADGSVIGPGEVCAFSGQGVGLCLGDVGDPLVFNGALVGFASWSIRGGCGIGVPDVYTRVSFYQDWINEIVERN